MCPSLFLFPALFDNQRFYRPSPAALKAHHIQDGGGDVGQLSTAQFRAGAAEDEGHGLMEWAVMGLPSGCFICSAFP